MQSNSPGSKPSVATISFEQVVSLCQAFSAEANAGSRPALAGYLERVEEGAQPALLRNLLTIDIEQRRAAGEKPRIDDYLDRFPQFATLIREVFLEASSASSAATHESARPSIAAAPLSGANRLGEYRLLGQLGRGGMGVVYEALHVQRGNRVALKTLPSLDGAALHRFKREFRALADTNHPNLIGLHTLEADGSQWFFTMDLIEGVTFLRYVRPDGVLDEARLRSALAQLVTGVLALHARHIIHRDLKPSNVLVTSDGHVIVLDFGLVLELDQAGFQSRTSDRVAGTPKYMAPEQAAAGTITPASDWYALGVILYEALAGKAPFSGTAAQVLHDKQRLDPAPLPETPAIPTDLAALCPRLLARDPQQRPDALEIAKTIAASGVRLDAALDLSPNSIQSGVKPPHSKASHLVGREQQLAALKDAARSLARQRNPLTVFISGRSGEGKTTLAEHFLTPLRGDQRLAVMAGRCYDRESVPFKALDTLIDALSSFLRSLPPEDAALLMPDDIGALAQVFPVLQRVEVVARASDPRLSTLDEQQVRGRAFRALRSLLSRVSRRLLIIWFIDDLQWGDADSAEALFEVLRPPEAPTVLFLGAYRSDETEGSVFLKRWKELQRKHGVEFADREVKVGPLTAEECTELVINLVGRDTEVVRRRAEEFARETRGNPFLLIELVGCFDPDTDSFEPLPLNEALARKLGRLPDEAGPLLEAVAISGQPLSLEEAARTAGHELLPVATLTRMRNERLVRLVGPEDRPLVDTYHDRVRESVLGRLDEGRCQTLHRTLADVIEKDAGGLSPELVAGLECGERCEEKVLPRVYDLAYHYDAAGEKRKAWMYALLAAEQARRQSALEVAANNYAIARRNVDETANAVRYPIAEGYGATLMLLGRYEEAADHLGGAIDLTEDAEKKARIEMLQGELAFNKGLVKRDAEIQEGALRRLGVWVPRSRLGLIYGLARESLVHFLHSMLPFLSHRERPNEQRELVIRLLYRLSQPYCFQNSPKWLYAIMVGLNRAELLPPSPLLRCFYAHQCCMLSMFGWHRGGSRYGHRAMALANEFNDVWGKGQCCSHYGIGLQAAARYDESIATLGEAISAYEKSGDMWELHLAHFHKGCCHLGLGNLAEAIAEARWTFASSARVGDSRTMCSSWLWARATRGNIPFEQLKGCIPCRPDDVMSTVHALLAEGYWHTFHQRTAEALKVYERAAEMVRTSLCMNSHTILVLPMLAMGVRLHADAVQANAAQQAEQLRQRAGRVAKWATRLTWLFPAAYPLALRERALILAACGKTKQALKFADRSCAVAEAQKAKYEHAQSLLVRGQLAKELGQPEADEQIRSATAALEEIERPVRELTAGNAVGAPSTSQPQLAPQKSDSPPTPIQPAPPTASRSLRGPLVALLVALSCGVLLGHLLGWCLGYVLGFVAGAVTGDVPTWTAAGAAQGATVGWVAFPLVLLLGGLLVRWGQRHHEAEIRRRPGAVPNPPPAVVRFGLQALLGVLGVCLSMIPAALGIWLGSVLGHAVGGVPEVWALTLGVLGLALPVVLWWRAR